MNDKKKIIVNEIEYWKKNQLLPEHYCNFLLRLYLEEEDVINSKAPQGKKKNSLIFTSIISFIIFSALVLYFSDFSNQMQMSFLLFLTIFLYLFSVLLHKKEKSYAHLLFSLSCLLMFIAASRFIFLWNIEDLMSKAMILIGVCLIWLITGVFFSIFYLQLIGTLATIAITAWSLLPYFQQNFSWVILELVWLSLFGLFFFISHITRRINVRLSLNLYINSLFILFIPIIQGMYIVQASLDILQLLLFAKIILFSLIVYFSKNRLNDVIKLMSN